LLFSVKNLANGESKNSKYSSRSCGIITQPFEVAFFLLHTIFIASSSLFFFFFFFMSRASDSIGTTWRFLFLSEQYKYCYLNLFLRDFFININRWFCDNTNDPTANLRNCGPISKECAAEV
jgi:hypothetical protein